MNRTLWSTGGHWSSKDACGVWQRFILINRNFFQNRIGINSISSRAHILWISRGQRSTVVAITWNLLNMAGIVDRMRPFMPTSYDLMRLYNHPMFVDLQATLANDVHQSAIPYSLVDPQALPPTTTTSTTSACGLTTSGLGIVEAPPAPEKVTLIVEDAALQAEFRQLASLNNARITELELFYQTQSAAIVTQRTDAISALMQTTSSNGDSLSSPDRYRRELARVNQYYDRQQCHLTARVNSSLQLVKRAMPADVAPPGGKRRKTKSRNLSAEAVDIMRAWYEAHMEHPYPTDDEKASMADRGGITVAQVKAWFANKRNRTLNTRPKRQKFKLHQQMGMADSLCSTILDAESANVGPSVRSDFAYLIDEISDLVTIGNLPGTRGSETSTGDMGDQNGYQWSIYELHWIFLSFILSFVILCLMYIS